ncbi:hypothetical protein Tco_0247650 [Tanacetum coccineum]
MNLASIDAMKKVLIVVVEVLGAQTIVANWIFLEKMSMVAPHLEDDAQYWFLKLDRDRPHMDWKEFRTIVADDLVLMVVVFDVVILASVYAVESIVASRVLENSLEVLKVLENSLESLKVLKNNSESLKVLENNLESLKVTEYRPVDGLVPLSIKKFTSKIIFPRLLKSKENNF